MSDNNPKNHLTSVMAVITAVSVAVALVVSFTGGIGTRERVARLEAKLENIDETLIDLRADVRKLVEMYVYQPRREGSR